MISKVTKLLLRSGTVAGIFAFQQKIAYQHSLVPALLFLVTSKVRVVL